jgi:hypothetical protein
VDKVDKTDNKKKIFIENLKKSLGIISTACTNTGICRSTFYKWVKNDEEFKREYDEISEYVGDFVESKLLKLINESHPTALIFYCKTKLKNRGYIERTEWTGADGGAIRTESKIDYKKLSTEELKTIEALLEKAKAVKE